MLVKSPNGKIKPIKTKRTLFGYIAYVNLSFLNTTEMFAATKGQAEFLLAKKL